LNGQLCNGDFSAPSERRGLKMRQLASSYMFVRLSPCSTRTCDWILMKLNIWQLYQKNIAVLEFSVVKVMDVLREYIKVFLR